MLHYQVFNTFHDIEVHQEQQKKSEFEPQVMPLQATNPALPAYQRNPKINPRIENKAITAQATALHRGHAQ